jgi:2-(1,2-epoxy-1,2-dihydrophenyl)acetyl-CoA isomerase
MDAEPVLLTTRDGAIVQLTLNRPRALNALDETLLRALDAALAALEPEAAAERVRALVLTGAGRAFSFGADLATLDAGDAEARQARFGTLLPVFQRAIRRLADFSAPTLAVLNGFAAGAGLDLALACDLRVASDRVKLASGFVGMGLVPDGGSTFHLPRLVGTGRALEMILLGDALTAEAALAAGLVNRVVRPAELAGAAHELASRLAATPRPAARLARELVRTSGFRSFAEALGAEADAQLECAASPAAGEALAAARRRPARAVSTADV